MADILMRADGRGNTELAERTAQTLEQAGVTDDVADLASDVGLAAKHPALAAFDKLFGQFSNTMDKAAGIEREEGHTNAVSDILKNPMNIFNNFCKSMDKAAGIQREEGHKNTFEKLSQSLNKRFDKVAQSKSATAGQIEIDEGYNL